MDSRMSFGGAAAMLCLAAYAFAAPPLAGSWNITPTGSATSSGELLFRVTPGSGEDPIEVTVSVLSGASDISVARKIRQTLSTQLRRDQYNVELGEGTNVLLTDPRGRPNFSLELVDSDVDNLRVAVRNIEPAATPTVPTQSVPAAVPPAAGSPANPQPANPTPDNGAQPATPTPGTTPNGSPAPPLPNPTPNGSPAAPLPNPTPNGSPAAPPPNATPDGTPAGARPPTR
jgi:hypothetical protein